MHKVFVSGRTRRKAFRTATAHLLASHTALVLPGLHLLLLAAIALVEYSGPHIRIGTRKSKGGGLVPEVLQEA